MLRDQAKRQSLDRLLSSCVAASSLILLSACNAGARNDSEALAGIKNGLAKRLLQQQFDSLPQCAQVLVTDSNGLMRAAPDSPAARALLASGLIVLDPRPGPEGGGDRFFLPAPNAKRWFARTSSERTAIPAHLLCFARRQVSAVWLDPSSSLPIYRYGFRLVDPAPWLANPAMRESFPAVRAALAVEFVGDEYLPVRDGEPDLSRLKPTDLQSALFAFQVSFTNRVIE